MTIKQKRLEAIASAIEVLTAEANELAEIMKREEKETNPVEQKPKTLEEKIEKLKHEVSEGYGYELIDPDNPDAFETEEWTVKDWKNYFYGSGDPMVEEECYIRNLSEYVFRNVGLMAEIISDMWQEHERALKKWKV